MEAGFVGEYYVYHIDDNRTLLVDPDEEIAPNFEHFKKFKKDFSEKMFRGLRAIVLKEKDKLTPVKIENSNEFYEGLYFLVKNPIS